MIARYWVAALASGVLALAACSPNAQSAEERMRAEFLQAESSGHAAGELYRALREAEPVIYEEVIKTASAELERGASTFEAGAAARPQVLGRFVVLVQTADDEHVNELLAFSREQMAAALEIDPMLCVNLSRGVSDRRVAQLPQDMQDRELRLMAKVIAAGPKNNAAASMDALDAWAAGYVTQHTEIYDGLMLMDTPSPTPDEARKICDANIVLLDGFIAQAPVDRARLFRATLVSG